MTSSTLVTSLATALDRAETGLDSAGPYLPVRARASQTVVRTGPRG